MTPGAAAPASPGPHWHACPGCHHTWSCDRCDLPADPVHRTPRPCRTCRAARVGAWPPMTLLAGLAVVALVACRNGVPLAPTALVVAPTPTVVTFLREGTPAAAYPLIMEGPTMVGAVSTDARGSVCVSGPCQTPTMLRPLASEWWSFSATSVHPCGGPITIALVTPRVVIQEFR